MQTPIYSIKDLHVSIKNQEILNIKQFDIHRGACYAFEGRMGSGKTTFLQILYSRWKIYSGEITNPRELSAFEDEIANLSDLIERADDTLLLQMEESDKYDDGLEKASIKHEAVRKQHESLSGELQTEREQLSALIQRDTPVRDTTRSLLSAETLRIYDNIRKSRDGIAVSSVESNRCSTCRINIPLQMIQKLKSTSEFVYCNSCRRILLMNT